MKNKLKNKYSKYFTFKETINGTDYFKRGLVGGLIFFIPIMILLGLGVFFGAKGSTALTLAVVLLSLVLCVPYLWFSLATTWKRINAFWPKYTTKILIATLLISILVNLLDPKIGVNNNALLFLLAGIPSAAFNLYILFANSKIKKHIG
ncbi:MAG: hypothetical protein GY920_09520 [Aliivibrio sp.]|nr:hypothetical protein [Aliivibrio sp.]